MSADYVEKLTDPEIKIAYENNANTNEFNDTEKAKLGGVEDNATADQTDVEIKTAYENNVNTNAYTDTEQNKLNGIEAGAEINIQTDWDQTNNLLADYLKNKPATFPPSAHNHDERYYTETELDILFSGKLDVILKGVANGLAELDSSGKVPLSQISVALQNAIKVVGSWNANTNIPDLSILTPTDGNAYTVSVGGSTDLGGETNWKPKDLAVYYASDGWFKLDNTDDVLSVNGKTGTIVITPDDLDDTGTSNKFTTQAEIDKLAGIAPGAEVNVNTDWDATSGDAELLNKPITITEEQATEIEDNTASRIDLETYKYSYIPAFYTKANDDATAITPEIGPIGSIGTNDYAPVKFNDGMRVTASNMSAKYNNATVMPNKNTFIVESWIKFSVSSADWDTNNYAEVLWSNRAVSGSHGIYILMAANANLTFYIGGTGGLNKLIDVSQSWAANEVVHIMTVWDNTSSFDGVKTGAIFWNGTQIGSTSSVDTIVNPATNFELMGWNGIQGLQHAYLDEVKIYDQVSPQIISVILNDRETEGLPDPVLLQMDTNQSVKYGDNAESEEYNDGTDHIINPKLGKVKISDGTKAVLIDKSKVNDGTAVNIDLSKENIVTVAKNGGDFTSIKSAIDSLPGTTETSVMVFPGVFIEDNPIQGKAKTTVKVVGGLNTVKVSALNADENLFDGVSGFYLEDVVLKDVSGVGVYAFEMLNTGACLLDNVIFENCSGGIHLNNALGQIILRDAAVQTLSTIGVFVEAGNLLMNAMSVVGLAAVGTVMHITGADSIATVSGITSFSPNVTTGFYFQNESRVILNASTLIGATDGVILDNGTSLTSSSLRVFSSQNDGVRIDDVGSDVTWDCTGCSIEGSLGWDINILSSTAIISGTGKTSIDKINAVDGAGIYGSIVDLKGGDEGVNILGELHVGTTIRPAESVFGAGDSHTFMYVYNYDGISTYTDKTGIAASNKDSTFSYDGITAGNAIYIANRYNVYFDGIKVDIDTAAAIGSGQIVIEYFNGGWVQVNGCTVKSTPGFIKFAKNYFNQSGGYHIKFNPYMDDDWIVNDAVGLGSDNYWVRFRIVTDITTSPIIQQIKIHTNRAEINTDGTHEAHADGRTYKKLVVDAVRPLEGNMQNASIYVDENVGVGLENNRFTTISDILGVSFELPEDCDTSGPLIFVWKGKFASTGDINFTVRRKIVKPGDAYTNAEPGPSGETETITTGLITIGAADVRGDYRVDLDISDAIPSRSPGFGDEIWVTIQLPVRGAGNFDYTKLSANYLSDFLGRHVRQ